MPLSPEQQRAHYNGIGGSMAPAIAGADEHCTPYQAWQRLTNPSSRPNLEHSLPVKLGSLFEPAIIELTAEHWPGMVLMPPNPSVTFHHRTIPHFLAHPDALVANESAAVEVKFRGANMLKWYEETDGEPLLKEYVQCQWQCMCVPVEAVYLTVVLGNARVMYWRIERNAEDIDWLTEHCGQFWEKHVLTGVPPEPETAEDVRSRFPVATAGKVREAGSIEAQIVADALRLRTQIDALQAQYDEARAWLEMQLKDAEAMRYNGQMIATYKSQKRTDIDVKRLRAEAPNLARTYERETNHRVLRLRSIAGG